MNQYEASQYREAHRAAPLVPEGDVSDGGGCPEKSGRPSVRFRLKRSVDCFADIQGNIQMLHDGLEERYEIHQPEPCDLMLLDLLQSGFMSEQQMKDRLREQGRETETVGGSLMELERIGVIERDEGRDLLSSEEAERFDRQLIYLADVAPAGTSAWQLQRCLRESHVAVLGCGGLGSWAATGLALAGIGKLTLIDDDTVELSNLNRQLLFRTCDLGRAKVEAAAESLSALDPGLNVVTMRKRLDTVGELTALAADADFLVMTADQPAYELPRRVNQACLQAGTAWISAGQIPPVIRIGPTVIPGKTPCHECQEESFRRSYPQYESLAQHRSQSPTDAATLGPASGTIGSLLAMEVIHHLTATAKPATLGQAMLMDLRTLTVEFEPIEPDPGCKCRELP